MRSKLSLLTVFILLCCGASMTAQDLDLDWANLGRYRAANEALEAPGKKEDRVVFMGNSITEKWGFRDSTFWIGKPYVNRGISGQVTSQMLLRFRPDVLDLKPTAVVLLAGTNDIAENKGPISLELIAGNIFSMIELAQANDIEVVLCSVLPAVKYRWRPEIKPADKIVELNKLLEAYATEHKICYIDCYSLMVNENKGLLKKYSPDGVHPNYDGYQLMGDIFDEAIESVL